MRLSILYKYKYFALEKSRVSHERNRGEARDRPTPKRGTKQPGVNFRKSYEQRCSYRGVFSAS